MAAALLLTRWVLLIQALSSSLWHSQTFEGTQPRTVCYSVPLVVAIMCWSWQYILQRSAALVTVLLLA